MPTRSFGCLTRCSGVASCRITPAGAQWRSRDGPGRPWAASRSTSTPGRTSRSPPLCSTTATALALRRWRWSLVPPCDLEGQRADVLSLLPRGRALKRPLAACRSNWHLGHHTARVCSCPPPRAGGGRQSPARLHRFACRSSAAVGHPGDRLAANSGGRGRQGRGTGGGSPARVCRCSPENPPADAAPACPTRSCRSLAPTAIHGNAGEIPCGNGFQRQAAGRVPMD